MKLEELRFGTELIKRGFASMQKGGVIMDVVNAEQAQVAEDAGAVAVMALERVPADIRATGGVARMADPQKIIEIMDAVSIPVMGKVRIGHFVEAQVLEALGVDMIDESEVLTPADEQFHIDKTRFSIPFVCGARDLGEALRRINEGAAMIRTKGEREPHARIVRWGDHMDPGEVMTLRNSSPVPADRGLRELHRVCKLGRLPVVNFSPVVSTPATRR